MEDTVPNLDPNTDAENINEMRSIVQGWLDRKEKRRATLEKEPVDNESIDEDEELQETSLSCWESYQNLMSEEVWH